MPRFFKRYDHFPGLYDEQAATCQRNNGADQSYLARLFKFPQMDFEMAIWEMTSLLIAPKKVFRSIYYHVGSSHYLFDALANPGRQKRIISPKKPCSIRCSRNSTETKNTYHRADPSFTYLLAFFMLLTGIAWGIAYAPSLASAIRLPLIFVFVHFLAISVLVAIAAFFLVGRLLGPGIAGLPGRRRQQGLFTPVGEGESLEFGYCFDVGAPGMGWF